MRFVSAQLATLLEDNAHLAYANAHHANGMAEMLDQHIRRIAERFPEVSIPNPTEANAVFPIFPAAVTEELQQNYRFYTWNQATGQVRLMCAWDTRESDVVVLLDALKKSLENHSTK
jgi:threonine aldolase